MTKTLKNAMRQMHIPAVRYSADYGQWFVRIGYRRSAKTGQRQRAFQYLGKFNGPAPTPPPDAIAEAVRIKLEWAALKRKNRHAVWPDGPAVVGLTEAETASEVNRILVEASEDDGQEQVPMLRIEQVRELYLQNRKTKIGIIKGQGVNGKTYTNEVRNLKAALEPVAKHIVSTYGYADLDALKDAIFRRVSTGDNAITPRTANNYWNEVRRLFEWSDRTASIPYRHAEHVTDLFAERSKNPNPIKIAPYNKEQLKTLLAKATDRQRLYIYLAMNCGHTQVDVGGLQHDEIMPYMDKPSIIRLRSKTSHQNDFKALHTLWPETHALLMKLLAPKNKYGLALLSEASTPLYTRQPHRDSISKTYLLLQNNTGVDLSFKQFRKIGSTAIQRIGGDEARRMYKAGTIDSGDKVYVAEAWDKLTPHLMAWGDQLRADGVLF